MSTAPNSAYPYKVGGSLDVNHPTYVVRQADKDFYDGLKRGEFCYVLNSRQTGKSSLRVQTMHKLQAEGIACADIDLTGIVSKQSTEEQWYRDIIKELVSCFQLKVNRRTWWREHDDLSCVHRFSVFVEEVLLAEVTQNIVIFVDEIDSVLSLDFPIDDFFAQIRYFYNKRANKSQYKRLTFALLGVATPSDLIADKNRTPFNIGRAVELYGFQPHEAAPLAQGLVGKVSNPQAVLREVLQWTGGQPFLTQKLCQLVLIAESSIAEGNEAEWVEKLVRSHVIQNWESQDDPEHLRTIRDRILSNEQRTSRLLGLYQQILIPPQPPLTKGGEQDLPPLIKGGISADDSSEQMELRLSGLVVKQNGKLRVYNRIYEAVFDQSWVNQQLAKLRPYSEAMTAWLDSNRQDESRLLRSKALQDALAWAKDKSLSVEDYTFLSASQQKELEAERQAKQILEKANQQAEQLIREAKEGTRIEREGVIALRQFEAGEEINALLSAMEAGQALKRLVKDCLPLKDYPATSPLLALQVILDNIRERHQFTTDQTLAGLSFRYDGQHIITVSYEGFVSLWDLQGNHLAKFGGTQDDILSVRFSPNNQCIAMYSRKGVIYLWDLQGNQLGKISTYGNCSDGFSFSPNGQYIATPSEDGIARLWNLGGKLLTEFRGHQDKVLRVSFSPDGRHLGTASCDYTARLWDLRGNQLAVFRGHQHNVWKVYFSSDGQHIATTSNDRTVRLWDLQGNQLAQLEGNQFNVFSASSQPDGKRISTALEDGTSILWDLKGKQSKLVEVTEHDGEIINFSFSPDGKYIGTASDEGSAYLWNINLTLLAEFKAHQLGSLEISFSPDGQYLATASGNIVRLWNLNNNRSAKFKKSKQWFTSISFSPDGKCLATGSAYGAQLWDLQGNQLVEFKGHRGWVRDVKFSPDGKCIATASDDGTFRLWDLQGNQLVARNVLKKAKPTQPPLCGCSSVSFSPGGGCIATASYEGIICLWSLKGNQLAEFRAYQCDSDAVSVSFSPDRKRIITASYHCTAHLWDLRGNKLVEFKGHQSEVLSVSFSPDGKCIATASDDRTARLWDLQGNQLAELKGHQGMVNSVSFSPDGQRIATASYDGTARLWDLQGNHLAEFRGHGDSVDDVSFSPDGKCLAAVTNHAIHLWQIEDLDELLERGCNWLKYYLASHPEAREKLKVCQN